MAGEQQQHSDGDEFDLAECTGEQQPSGAPGLDVRGREGADVAAGRVPYGVRFPCPVAGAARRMRTSRS
ncbi:hypothetical protein F750_5837 [Streptomyces sp. PAMC 26508]|nr:hypothetical protein F750_5837 [Streptomyces sp. PAMC 26508]